MQWCGKRKGGETGGGRGIHGLRTWSGRTLKVHKEAMADELENKRQEELRKRKKAVTDARAQIAKHTASLERAEQTLAECERKQVRREDKVVTQPRERVGRERCCSPVPQGEMSNAAASSAFATLRQRFPDKSDEEIHAAIAAASKTKAKKPKAKKTAGESDPAISKADSPQTDQAAAASEASTRAIDVSDTAMDKDHPTDPRSHGMQRRSSSCGNLATAQVGLPKQVLKQRSKTTVLGLVSPTASVKAGDDVEAAGRVFADLLEQPERWREVSKLPAFAPAVEFVCRHASPASEHCEARAPSSSSEPQQGGFDAETVMDS